MLHVYLVGFESFEPFHLQLFNKGATVEDNLRAVEKLRELRRALPRVVRAREVPRARRRRSSPPGRGPSTCSRTPA